MTSTHSTPETALILGCGYTGAALIHRLRARGVAVHATTRTAEGVARIEALGAIAHVWSAPEPLPMAADTTFVLFPPRGTEPDAVADCLSGQARIVYCSSTSVFGARNGGWVSDNTEPAPISPWAHARVATEAALRPLGAVMVRAAGIYGPERNICRRLKAGRVRVTGDLQRPVNLIHVDDLAQILDQARLAEPGGNLLAASGRPVSWLELVERAAELTGIAVPDPAPLPDDPNLRMFYTETKRCRPTRFDELGIALQHPDVLEALADFT